MRKEINQYIAEEYRYAVTKMQELQQPNKKLFYFSVFFGVAQRALNLEWNTDLALVHMITQNIHTQLNSTMQMPGTMNLLPLDWSLIYDKLTQNSSDLASYFEQADKERSKEELYRIFGCFAEIAYAITGNGSYLHEKGLLKL